MKVTDFLKFRDKCRFIITESRRVADVPMTFYIDDIAILDIIDLDASEVQSEHIKFNRSRIVKALQEYNTIALVRISYLLYGSSNVHYDYIPTKYLLPEYSDEDIKKDLQKRLELAEKLGMTIYDIDDLYALMTVEI